MVQLVRRLYAHKTYIYLWKVCVERGIPYIVVPYEADAQIALLLSEGYADIKSLKIQISSPMVVKR